MKPGPKKRVFQRISVSLAKGQKATLEAMADSQDTSIAKLVRDALHRTYGKRSKGGA